MDEIIRRGEDTLLVAHFGSIALILYHLGLAAEEQLFTPEWAVRQGTYSAVRIENGRAELIFHNR